MSHFLVFVPGASGQDPKILEGVGLADLWQGAEFMDIASGPNGRSGVLVSWRRPGGDMRFQYTPELQTWTPAAESDELAAGRYWIGVWNGRNPTPDELRRNYSHLGERFIFGDGNEWVVPHVGKLPHDLILADDNSIKFELQRKYHDYWLEMELWRNRMASGQEPTLIEASKVVRRGLNLNYRLPHELAYMLRLFSSDKIGSQFLAVIGAGE